MEILVYILVATTRIMLSILLWLMFARAILSWFPFDDETPIIRFLTVTTEPFIVPVRSILERIGFFSGLPIDLSFFFTYIIITVITYALPAIHF